MSTRVSVRMCLCVCWAMRGKISSVCYHLLSASLLGVIRWGTACYGRALLSSSCEKALCFRKAVTSAVEPSHCGLREEYWRVSGCCAHQSVLSPFAEKEKEMCHILNCEQHSWYKRGFE